MNRIKSNQGDAWGRSRERRAEDRPRAGHAALGVLAGLWLAACGGAGKGEVGPENAKGGASTLGATTVRLVAGAGLCADAAGNADANGTPVQLWSCNGSTAQRWKYRTDHAIELRNGQCLDIQQAQLAQGTPLQMWQCNGTNAQRWLFGADGQLHAEADPSLCVDVAWGSFSDGARLRLWDCNGTNAQAWRADDVRIVGLASKCVDARNNATADRTPIQLWTCNGTTAQAWSYHSNHTLELRENKCLDVEWGMLEAGTPLHLWECNGTAAQRWLLGPSGQIRLESDPTLCLDVAEANGADGTRLQLWRCNGTAAQRWTLQNLVLSLSDVVAPLPEYARTIPLADLNTPGAPLRGIVDMHTHPMSHLAMGGTVFHGAPDVGSWMPEGMTGCGEPGKRSTTAEEALASCEITHASENACGNVIRAQLIGAMEAAEGAQNVHGSTTGWPDLRGWPAANDISHQIMWVDWIERSFRYGLRVVVALAHNSETFAVATSGTTPREDFASAQLQLMEIEQFVARHDFMELARSPQQLRTIVGQDRLAVVLGVEVDDLGGTQAEIESTVGRYYDLGARYIFPVHLTDNRIGGTAVSQDLFQVANRYQTGSWWELKCGPSDITYQSSYPGALIGPSLILLHLTSAPPPPPRCSTGHVNRRGLSLVGPTAILYMMRRGMMIDIDHMSIETVNSVLELAERVDYPVNSGHSGLRSRLGNEAARSSSDYRAISTRGGLAGVGWSGASADEYAVRLREVSATGVAVALGTDANSMVSRPPAPNPEATRLARWHYPTDGVVHYGLIPEYLDATRAAGGEAEVAQLFQSAEAFARMWEKSLARSASIPAGPSELLCSTSSHCDTGAVCVSGRCWDITSCDGDSDCPSGYVCASETGRSCPGAPLCSCVAVGGGGSGPDPDPGPATVCSESADCGDTTPWCLNHGLCGAFPEQCLGTKMCPVNYSCVDATCQYAGSGPAR